MCKAYYKFTIFMIFVEMTQLISVGVAPASFLLRHSTDPLWLNHVFGAIVSASWFTYSFLIHMIAVNRFVCMYFQPNVVKVVFSDRNVHLIIVSAYFYGLVWLLLFLTAGKVSFDLSSFVYLYEKDTFSQKIRSVEIVVDVGNGIAILCWYILIFLKLKAKNNQITDRTISARNAKVEMKVFIQAALLCFMTCFLIFTWFVIPIITDNDWVDLGTNYVWLLVASLNAILYLTFNKNPPSRAPVYTNIEGGAAPLIG
uniref:7TM_GPCR_Srx domain-containing protein n=1 Tax=Romanomermis culicivorax TaxID=13658 RepID=A0A915KLW2_ROMCU